MAAVFFVLGAVRAKLKCHPCGVLNGKCNVYAVFTPRAGVHTARRGLRRLPMVCHPCGVLFSALRAIETSTGCFFCSPLRYQNCHWQFLHLYYATPTGF